MRFLADENFPAGVVVRLTAMGHDTANVSSAAPGMSDQDVLSWAVRERRILLTFDKDFGELARTAGMPADCGIILFRVPAPRSAEDITRVVSVLDSRDDWVGHFAVVEPGRVRMRALAAGG